MYMLEGVSSVANFITAYEESQENRDHFLMRSVFFVSKGNLHMKRLFCHSLFLISYYLGAFRRLCSVIMTYFNYYNLRLPSSCFC